MQFSVANHQYTPAEALDRLAGYPRLTPPAFDYPGTGKQGLLTGEEVRRTRKISSRISEAQVEYFVQRGSDAPWVKANADLADAAPGSPDFEAMTALYWHFWEGAPEGVNFAKISKVLHLKNPSLFPILDRHIKSAYAPTAKSLRGELPELGWRRRTWVAVRNDLLRARESGGLRELREDLTEFEAMDAEKQRRVRQMTQLSDLRLLDILVW